MHALVKILKNTQSNTFHPIFYFENWFPGGESSQLNEQVIRYKSKGHHTLGFDTRTAAVLSIENELINQIKSVGYTPILEIKEEEDFEWDGKEIPADVQIRNRN